MTYTCTYVYYFTISHPTVCKCDGHILCLSCIGDHLCTLLEVLYGPGGNQRDAFRHQCPYHAYDNNEHTFNVHCNISCIIL